MYDKFPVPDSVTELRLVRLEGLNLNSQVNPILKSTALLGKVEITKFKHNASAQTLEISLKCHPAKEGERIIHVTFLLGKRSACQP